MTFNELTTTKDRSAPKQVTGRLREALLLMAHEGKTYQAAGAAVGFHAKSMRKALAKPWVLKYLSQERSNFLAADSARNAHRLIELREQESNPAAAVRACVAIEQIRTVDDASHNGARAQLAGFTIIVQPATRDDPLIIAGRTDEPDGGSEV